MPSSPMMQQYHDAKALCGDALLLFRMGDFYELFYEDAQTAASRLGLTLTSREKGAKAIPMAGFPHHQLDSYLAKLIQLGFRVAVCEQVEDARHAQGLVRREVTRVVTPGTLTDDSLLNPRENNFLAAAVHGKPLSRAGTPLVGLAWIELSTGSFFAASVPWSRLADELARLQPAEYLVAEDDPALPPDLDEQLIVTRRPGWVFGEEEARAALLGHFQTSSLEGFGLEEQDRDGLRAAGAILEYLAETQRSSLQHIDRLLPYRSGDCLEIDQATRRSLELTRTLRDGQREGSLLWVLDRTCTGMGSRLLTEWLAAPLTQPAPINARLDAVEALVGAPQAAQTVRTELQEVYDLQRLLTRVTTGRVSPRDLQFIGRTLEQLPRLKSALQTVSGSLLAALRDAIDPCPQLQAELASALVDHCPLSSREGGMIRHGYHPPLDELRQLATGGKQWIARYQASEQERTRIPSLKVGYNKVFGFYIEITHAHADKIPAEYIRKQTLKNAERYITPELKEYEHKVLSAEETATDLEYELFGQLKEKVESFSHALRATAAALAQLDVLQGLAHLATARGYCRPEITEQPLLQVVAGRHPVLDVTQPQGEFVPNDASLHGEGNLLLITGPNMAGKSTYIRQVALICLMGQMGSFVPAQSATLGISDRVFARVGASDELARGQSTFMVEMLETARILHTATARSLVILDEIGRGTSTYDGVSLAWAIVEHIHDRVDCRTLFATHYHELTQLAESHPRVRNLNVLVKEWRDQVIFLHQIVPGPADKSYGIHVAKLAGVPAQVTQRAAEILRQLEAQHVHADPERQRAFPAPPPRRAEFQLTLFDTSEHPVVEEIRQFRVDEAAAGDALQQIRSWQRAVQAERRPPR